MSSFSNKKKGIEKNTDTINEIFLKALKSNSEWTDKDDFLDVVYWMRQIVGIIVGLVLGILAIKGIIGIALFIVINISVTYFYATIFQKIDEEIYGGVFEVLKEGLVTSLATFFVTWIVCYSAIHID